MGQDGSRLLRESWTSQAPEVLRSLPEVEGLRRTWVQPCLWQEGQLQVRTKNDFPPAPLTIRSPDDLEAHYGHKRDLSWFGYTVHLTETCDEQVPHLITHVVTSDATETDVEQTQAIHQAMAHRDLLPTRHLVDAGDIEAELLVQSQQQYHMHLVGPVSPNHPWQAKEGQGSDLASFNLDWQEKSATCLQGKQSVTWTERTDQHGHPKIAIRFGLSDCRDCPARSLCTRSATAPRMLAVRYQAEFEVLLQARSHQQTKEFRDVYAQRSGIEGTHSQGVRSLGLRRTRSCGLAKTSLQHFGTAAALNLIRLDAFFAGKKTAKTRTSRFAAFAPVDLAGEKGSPAGSKFGMTHEQLDERLTL